MFPSLGKYFLRGLLIVAPIGVTIYVAWIAFVTIDGWINIEPLLDRRVPGAGIVITLALITFIGFLASNIATRWMFSLTDGLFTRLPLIKLLYNALKDLINAFVGEKKRFDKPVAFRPTEGSDLTLFGFLTRDDLEELGLPGHVSVYVPQSYNFAGNVVIVPRERVRPLEVDSTAAMTFIVSGGVSRQANNKANNNQLEGA